VKRSLISAACCALIVLSAAPLRAQQSVPVSGIDLKTLDTAVRPQDDFYG
jgi:hypothetical protein